MLAFLLCLLERVLATFCLIKHTLFFCVPRLKKVKKVSVDGSALEAVIVDRVRSALCLQF